MAEKKPARKKAENKPIGEVTHYFSNIEVAVVRLSAALAEGDKIRIAGGESTDFEQTIKSMQADHKKIKKAKKGAEVGLKVKDKVREGYKVYKA